MEPTNRKIEAAQSALYKSQENSKKIEGMLEILSNKQSMSENISLTKEKLITHTKQMDEFMIRYNQKITEQQRTNNQIGETMKEIKAVQNKLQKLDEQKQVVEYFKLKRENEEMYEMLKQALQTQSDEEIEYCQPATLEIKLSEFRSILKKEEEKLKQYQTEEIAWETTASIDKREIEKLRKEIIQCEEDMAKVDHSITSQDKLYSRYKSLKEEKSLMTKEIAILQYCKSREDIENLLNLSREKNLCFVCCRTFDDEDA